MGDINRLFAQGLTGGNTQQPDQPAKGGALGPIGVPLGLNLQDTPGLIPDSKGVLEGKPLGGGLAGLSSPARGKNWMESFYKNLNEGIQAASQGGSTSGGSASSGSSSGGGSSGGGGSAAPVSSGGGGGGASSGGAPSRGGSMDSGLAAAIAQASGISISDAIVSAPPVHIDHTPSAPVQTPAAPPAPDGPLLA